MNLLAEILLPLSGLRHHEILIVEHNLSLSFFQEKVDSIMPDFFSWLVDKKVCGMGFPWDKENIRYLLDNNVYYLISLTEETQPKVDTFPGNYIINISRGFCESGIYLFIWYMLRRSTLCFKLPHAIVYSLFCLHIFFSISICISGRRCRGPMVVEFTTTCAISVYHH